MSAVLSGSQPDGSFDWGEAGKGALIGAAMPVGMMGSVLAPYAPALLGVSGALGSAALAGGAMFGSVTLTTGTASFATNGTFSPNLKAAGISAGITALFAGIEGGVFAKEHDGNFWTGKGTTIINDFPANESMLGGEYFKDDASMHTYIKSKNGWEPGEYGIDDIDVDDNFWFESEAGNIRYRDNNGVIFRFPEDGGLQTRIAGFVKSQQTGVFSRNVNIYMSPHKTLSDFTLTLNHEFIHAYHHVSCSWIMLGNQFHNFTEHSAWTYSSMHGVRHAVIGLQKFPYYGPYNIFDWPNYLIPVR